MHIKLRGIIILCLFSPLAFSQSLAPLEFKSNIYFFDSVQHHSFLPVFNVDTTPKQHYKKLIENSPAPRILNHFFNDHHLTLDTGTVKIALDLIVNVERSKELSHRENIFLNSRGYRLQGQIGKQVTFGSVFSENQGGFPTYVDSFITKYRVIPGQGRRRAFGANYDYGYSEAYLTYSPGKIFSFQAGQGKNFIGDGYRSLILSDNAFSYPYLKINTQFWKIKYTNLYTQFQDLMKSYSYSTWYEKKNMVPFTI